MTTTSTLTTSQLIAACEQWTGANVNPTKTKGQQSPDTLFKELLHRYKQETSNEKNKQYYEILREVYTMYWNNEIYVEALHEMFLSFLKGTRRHDTLHDQVIFTYENLRHLLRTSEKVFLSEGIQKEEED